MQQHPFSSTHALQAAQARQAPHASLGRWQNWPRQPLIWVVQGYRLLLKPWIGNSCRFEPTCSAYTLQALQQHGAWRGTALGGWRLLRCHPWCEGGHDPVPPYFAGSIVSDYAAPDPDLNPDPSPDPSPDLQAAPEPKPASKAAPSDPGARPSATSSAFQPGSGDSPKLSVSSRTHP